MSIQSLRYAMISALAAAVCLTAACFHQPTSEANASQGTLVSARSDARALPPLVDDLEHRTFDYFWELGNPANGLVPDRWPTPSFSSIAAVGFGLTAYGVGVERGWISRDQAVDRTLATLRFFANARQGEEVSGTSGYKGFFYHFLEMDSGARSGTNEVSTVDTALLLAGVLFAQTYYDRGNPKEAEIRALAETIYSRVQWPWAQERKPWIAMGWTPEHGMHAYDWKGYNEAILVYIEALGSTTHPVDKDAYAAWTSTYDQTWGTFNGQEHLSFPPLFGHQYSEVWLDLRGIQDDYMRRHGIDYFENSRRAVLSQRAYAIENPSNWEGYGRDIWGLTASDGPIDATLSFKGASRLFRTYSARGAGIEYVIDDGTIAPTAAAGSIAFAPEIVIPAITALHDRYGADLYGKYGFLDAFNPSFRYNDAKLHHGRLVPGVGWFDTDYLGIDQGPIVLMIENYRSGFVWSVMRRNPHIRRGLQRAGFTGGWLATEAPPRERGDVLEPVLH
ncbi:MAG: Tat pathway signal protein [Xanthomonadaceae bacterium]|nr:Tat pathway signal protein [Xanthomonadaceae bacterium]